MHCMHCSHVLFQWEVLIAEVAQVKERRLGATG